MKDIEKIKREIEALNRLIERKRNGTLFLNETLDRLLSMRDELKASIRSND